MIIGPGRVGGSIARACSRAGIEVRLEGRGFEPDDFEGSDVLLCVPDDSIDEVVSAFADSDTRLETIGHTSGATALDALSPVAAAGGRYSLHPLQTVPDRSSELRGSPAAVSADSESTGTFATGLAEALGMEAFQVPEEGRVLYHAAASVASNFLVTLEQAAAELMDDAGIDDPRSVLAPLVRRTVDNWVDRGAGALTGPVVRGDQTTVIRHREAIAANRPEMLDLYDGLVEETRAMIARRSEAAA